MFQKLIFFALVGAVVYLNYTNPTREQHEALLLAEIRKLAPVSEEQLREVMSDVDFSNFMICSAAKTRLDSKMISLGYLKKTRLVNDQWIKQAAQKLQGTQGY